MVEENGKKKNEQQEQVWVNICLTQNLDREGRQIKWPKRKRRKGIKRDADASAVEVKAKCTLERKVILSVAVSVASLRWKARGKKVRGKREGREKKVASEIEEKESRGKFWRRRRSDTGHSVKRKNHLETVACRLQLQMYHPIASHTLTFQLHLLTFKLHSDPFLPLPLSNCLSAPARPFTIHSSSFTLQLHLLLALHPPLLND